MEAIILAGGLGTRLRRVLNGMPKPLAPICGRPFLEYLMDYWISIGVTRFILSVGYQHEKIIQHFGPRYKGAELCYATEFEPLGTGGGLILASRCIKDLTTILVLNGDTLFEVDLTAFMKFHDKRQADVTVALTRAPSRRQFGCVTLDANDRIIKFEDNKEAIGKAFINGGAYLFKARVLIDLCEKYQSRVSLEREIFPMLNEAGNGLYGFFSDGLFIDIGVPQDYYQARYQLLTDTHARAELKP